jgi:hypothetical protein
MKRLSNRQWRFLILSLATIAFSLAYYAGTDQSVRQNRSAIRGTPLSPLIPVPTFELTDHRGKPYQDDNLAGHWSLLMLDLDGKQAPSPALIRLLQVHNHLASHPKYQRNTQFLYLSKLGGSSQNALIPQFDNNFYGLYTKPTVAEDIFRKFRIGETATDFVLYLISPEKHQHTLFTQAQDAATIAEDLIWIFQSDA